MSKLILESYEQEQFQALNVDGITYVLKGTKISFFGLIVKPFEMTYTIPYNSNFQKYFDRWDELIRTKKPLR